MNTLPRSDISSAFFKTLTISESADDLLDKLNVLPTAGISVNSRVTTSNSSGTSGTGSVTRGVEGADINTGAGIGSCWIAASSNFIGGVSNNLTDDGTNWSNRIEIFITLGGFGGWTATNASAQAQLIIGKNNSDTAFGMVRKGVGLLVNRASDGAPLRYLLTTHDGTEITNTVIPNITPSGWKRNFFRIQIMAGTAKVWHSANVDNFTATPDLTVSTKVPISTSTGYLQWWLEATQPVVSGGPVRLGINTFNLHAFV